MIAMAATMLSTHPRMLSQPGVKVTKEALSQIQTVTMMTSTGNNLIELPACLYKQAAYPSCCHHACSLDGETHRVPLPNGTHH